MIIKREGDQVDLVDLIAGKRIFYGKFFGKRIEIS